MTNRTFHFQSRSTKTGARVLAKVFVASPGRRRLCAGVGFRPHQCRSGASGRAVMLLWWWWVSKAGVLTVDNNLIFSLCEAASGLVWRLRNGTGSDTRRIEVVAGGWLEDNRGFLRVSETFSVPWVSRRRKLYGDEPLRSDGDATGSRCRWWCKLSSGIGGGGAAVMMQGRFYAGRRVVGPNKFLAWWAWVHVVGLWAWGMLGQVFFLGFVLGFGSLPSFEREFRCVVLIGGLLL